MVKRFVIAVAIAISTLSIPLAQAREADSALVGGKTATPPVITPEKKIWVEEAIDKFLTGDLIGLHPAPAPEAPKPTPRH